jgi:hypothetical protein
MVARIAHPIKNNSLDSIVFLVCLIWFKHLALITKDVKEGVRFCDQLPLFSA